MKPVYCACLLLLLTACSFKAAAQSPLRSVIDKINAHNAQLPPERLFIQTDKPCYLQDDTLWFKAYLLNAGYLTLSTRSALLYVELDNESNECVKRMMYPVMSGLCRGYMPLVADDIAAGAYTLRAYTSWMRNFGDDYIFSQQLYITPARPGSRLFNVNFSYTAQQGAANIRAGILMSNFDKQPTRLQDVQLRAMDNRSSIKKIRATSGLDGKLTVDFDLPAGKTTKPLLITEQDMIKNGEAPVYTIPVMLNRPEYTDLQFMPEGGALVAGLPANVGFKAIGEDGEGVNISGRIYDSKQQQVTDFTSKHKGMGSFMFTPQPGETYTAVVDLPGGSVKNYPLPPVSKTGIVLHVKNSNATESLRVTILATSDIYNAAPSCYLLGLSRGMVCYAARVSLNEVRIVFYVPKSAFPTGIVHFTLLNAASLPVAERLVFVDHHDNLNISITPDKTSYVPHDSVSLKIKVTNRFDKPVAGSFSMAATDDSQVKNDSLGSNIINNLLFTGDLKGNIEGPGYYFADTTTGRLNQLDNLLLTQGAVSYDWKQLFNNQSAPQYPAEREFAVKGTVTTFGNKPIPNTDVILMSKKPLFVADSVTDKDGRFSFSGFLPVDTAAFIVQARNKKGKSINVQVNVDEFKPPVFTSDVGKVVPWYVNTDTTLLNNINTKALAQQREEKLQGLGHVLQEVKIKDKKVVKGSKNLNGPGEADLALNEDDMDKAGKLTLAQLLEQKIKGYHSGYIRKSISLRHMVDDEPVFFVFDGVFINRFYNPSGEINGLYNYEQDYLNYYTAEDIKGIEVMSSAGYSTSYIIDFISPRATGASVAFIEITTRSGHGPFMNKTQGTYLYKPLAATLPKQFYRPRYKVKTPVTGADLRSTIHWQPDIITDTAGNATVSFYCADKAAHYTIIIQGIDLNGSLGFKREGIIVK
jgi:hypothetical protein